MERLGNKFLILALLALLVGAFFGFLAGFQYVEAEFLKDYIPFNKMRPLHVVSVLGWIILAATGGIYYYLTNVLKLKMAYEKLAKTHFFIFLICIIAIYLSLLSGNMGGREYLVYAPIISIPILAGWLLFGINYFKTVLKQVKGWPVYLWMWGTGIAFMFYHLTESHFWMIPHFRENFVRDMSVQWKSYGSFTGSWNLLVYGTATFLMAKIKNDDAGVARGFKPFFFYFLGLTNLMLGWAHHTYIIPTQPWVRYLAYGISMTEWVVLIIIIMDWKKSLSAEKKENNSMAYKFLMATDFWVFVNLFLALLLSIPYINIFTHGTHITVAHSMGTTIGINTTILLAGVFFILNHQKSKQIGKYMKQVKIGYWLFNVSLAVFFTCLMLAGVQKSFWMYFTDKPVSFGAIHNSIMPYMKVFLGAGLALFVSLILIAQPLIISLFVGRYEEK